MEKERRPKNIQGYKSLKRLAKDIANLSYNSVYIFLLCLGSEMLRASAKDEKDGKVKLAKKLSLVAKNLNSAGKEMGGAWDICEEHTIETEAQMKQKKGVSAKQIKEICQSEGITLEEYYQRKQDKLVPESEKKQQKQAYEEKAQKRLEKTLKH